MASNYETPTPITETSISHIHGRLDRAAARLNKKARRYTREEYYKHVFPKLPRELKSTVRSFALTAYPDLQEGKDMTIEALAVVQGLTIGIQIAKLALKRNHYIRYCEQMKTSLAIMEDLNGQGAYDLGQALKFTGISAISGIAHNLPPRYMLFSTSNDDEAEMNNALYAAAMGYSVAHAETMLCEAEIRDNQPLDYAARKAIDLDIGYLGDLALIDVAASVAQLTDPQ